MKNSIALRKEKELEWVCVLVFSPVQLMLFWNILKENQIEEDRNHHAKPDPRFFV